MYNKKLLALLIGGVLNVSACHNVNHGNDKVVVQLRVMETSDLHTNIMDYDYFKTKEDPTIGLARAASAVHLARNQEKKWGQVFHCALSMSFGNPF